MLAAGHGSGFRPQVAVCSAVFWIPSDRGKFCPSCGNQRQICCPRNCSSQSQLDCWSVTSVEFLMKPICMKSWSLQLYIYHSPFRPLKDWRRVERRHVPATAVCLAGLVGRGRKIISWATCASDTSHESCVCPPCSTCTTAPTCVVVAKCRDARFFTIFSGPWTPEGPPAAQHCCSEKSSQLQSNMS